MGRLPSILLALSVLVGARGALAQDAARQPRSAEREVRKREKATLLASKLPDAIRARAIGSTGPVLLTVVGGAGIVLFAVDRARQPLLFGEFALIGAGGVSYFVLPESSRNEGLATFLDAGMATFYLWMASLDHGLSRSLYPVASGYYGTALLQGLNAAFSRHPGVTRLRRDYALIWSPQGRRQVSDAQLAAIERDFMDTEPAIPQWLLGLPLVAGGAVALLPAFDEDADSNDRAWGATFGVLTMLQGFTQMALPNPVGEYRTGLVRANLTLSAVPGGVGLGLTGTF